MITGYRIVWADDHVAYLTDPDEAVAVLDKVIEQRTPTGDRPIAFIAPAGLGPELAIGIDPDHHRAIARWLVAPTCYAIQPDVPPHTDDINFYPGAYEQPPEWICAPAATRLLPDTARNIVRAHVATGRQPTCVEWELE